MNLHASRPARVAAALGIALAVLAEPLIGSVPAYAGTAKSPSYFNRQAVVGRAARWMQKGVPYNQQGWVDDYRSDCSGFVSYAWGLDQSYVTWTLPEVSRRIAKNDLQPGDIILNTARHVILFAGWANGAHTAYVGYEEAGSAGRAIRRVIPYPYDSPTAPQYLPYRYTGGHNLYAPNATLPAPLIQTYAGGGQVLTPAGAGAKNAQRARVAQRRAIDRLNRIHAAERAAAAAKAEAKAEAERVAAAAKAAAQQRLAAKQASEAVEPSAPTQPAKAAASPQPQPKPVILQLFHSLFSFLGA